MEFSWIDKYLQPLQPKGMLAVRCNNGDDAAVWQSPAGLSEVFSLDTACAGVHFPANARPDWIAYRTLACAVSDLAAMAAQPSFASLALTLPAGQGEPWLASFAQGLAEGLTQFGMGLIGGDTTCGPATVLSVGVHGWVGERFLRRDGAQAGDLIVLTGATGLAHAALAWLDDPEPPAVAQPLLAAYWRPQPQLAMAQQLLPYANAAIDVSDGLLADLDHLAQRSGLGYRLQAEQLPLAALVSAGLSKDDALKAALTGGDDYQLVLAIPARHWPALSALPLICLGEFTANLARDCYHGPLRLTFTRRGYQHHVD